MAAEFATSAAANAVGNLATEYASPYANYFFRFGRIVEEFKNQRKDLELKKGRLNIDVDEAVRQTEVIYEDVEDWLTRTERELREAQSLEDEIERNKCFNYCPSWGWRYCLSKKVARKTLCIRKLIDTCKFERLGHRLPLQGIEFLISKDFKASQSSTVAFNAIVEALTTEGVDMVGLNGMPGVGKTTLAKEVGKYVGEQKLFDKVVIVTMSQTPNISNIQDRIAEMLGLEFKAKTDEGKAEELVRRLKVEKILIIIDDVWKEFELKTIGIPYGGENNGCKILLTTRLQSICLRMNCQQKFELGILTEDEAWDLFKYYAGLEALPPTAAKLIEVAKELARECKGLPLAIKAVAGALKGQNLIAWETAHRKLKDSRHLDNEGVTGNIYRILYLSYDFLKEADPKSCFLLCSLFPEDYNIPIDRLALIAIGQGLFCRAKLMEEQRDEIRLALEELQQSGLLLEINDKENTVRMHNVVCDFAHWLTSKGDAKFMVRTGLTKWPMSETFESHTTIALWDFNMNSFPDKIEFKNLKTLILQGERFARLTIPVTFFEEMKELEVLWLEGVKFSLEVLRFLTNLRAILLFDCKLINKNISSLINTEKLEIFYVNDNEIDELSEDLERLRHLKYLYFGMDIKFPSKLLSRLTSLQELHILGRNNINLWELSSLSCLSALSLRVSPDDQCFEEGFVFPKTKRYSIAVNDEGPSDMEGQSLRILKIRNFSSSLSPFKKLLCDMKKLIFWNVYGDKYIVSNEEARELTELIYLQLVHCKDQEYLIEPAQNHANASTNLQSLKDVQVMHCRKLKSIFPPCVAHTLFHLQQLKIWQCDEIEQVFVFAENDVQIIEQHQNLHDHLHGNAITSLQSLKDVEIERCRKLKSIFSACVAHNLLHLQQLRISHCNELEQLFAFAENHGQIVEEDEENQLGVLSNLTCLKLEDLRKLRYLWSGPTYRVNLSSLNALEIYVCGKLEFLFSSSLARTLMHLEYVRIEYCKSLEHLISTEVENEDACCLPKLNILKIKYCKSLKDVFSITLAQGGLPALEKVEIIDCPQLMGLFSVPKESELKCLWKGPTHNDSLSSLRVVKISKCNGLKYVLPASLAQSLVQLQELLVDDCYQLEHIISESENDGEIGSHSGHDLRPLLPHLQNLTLFNLVNLKCLWKGPTHKDSLSSLKVIKISKCNGLKYVFPSSLAQSLVQLQQLHIAHCNQLEHIISGQSDIEIGSQCGNDLCPFIPNLRVLHLNNLMNLSGFYSENSPITVPLLNKLAVQSCPRLVNFSIQKKVNKEVRLKDLKFSKSGYDLINISPSKQNSKKVDYATILEIFEIEDEQLLSKVESIELNQMHQLRGPIKVAKLQYLQELSVCKCNGLKSLFSPMLARNLPQLTYLWISECEELEEIIDTTSASSSSSQAEIDSEACLPHKSFPNLESLRISSCNNLKSLFPVNVIHPLSKIRTIEIREATKLEQVFKYKAEVDINQDDQNHKRKILLPPSLRSFQLIRVSGLRSLGPMSYHLLFPSNCYIEISGYSNLLTSFSRDSNTKIVHAITQAQPSKYPQNDVKGDYDNRKVINILTDLPPYKEEE